MLGWHERGNFVATWTEETTRDRVVTLLEAGQPAKGEFRCAECGYGVAVHASLPSCPMCRARKWEPAPWRPFTRASTARLEPHEEDVRVELLL